MRSSRDPDGTLLGYQQIIKSFPKDTRAVFIYLAILSVYGFNDGNGRLARFLLGWETETAGIPAIVIPLNLHAELASSVHHVFFEAELEPLVSVLIRAHASTDNLLLLRLPWFRRSCWNCKRW